jgi:hypothetical protein
LGIGVFWAHFLRLRRKKPGYPGLRFAPAPALRAVAAPHPSYPLHGRKNGILQFFRLSEFTLRANSNISNSRHPCRRILSFLGRGFCFAKPQEMETAERRKTAM